MKKDPLTASVSWLLCKGGVGGGAERASPGHQPEPIEARESEANISQVMQRTECNTVIADANGVLGNSGIGLRLVKL